MYLEEQTPDEGYRLHLGHWFDTDSVSERTL